MTYNVADLVIPIPNFVPDSDGPGRRVQRRHGQRRASAAAHAVRLVDRPRRWRWWPASDGKGSSAMLNPNMLAQMATGGRSRACPAGTKNAPVGAGPGGLGGGAQADFDSLIDLITSTVKPTTWDAVGGPGSIAPFETNLSIVVSQTQDVHEEIVDLLEQLRRLQDLQVTIEVRFITLNDNFFERIGVSFDFDINDNIDGKGIRVRHTIQPPAPARHRRTSTPARASPQRHQRRTATGRSPSA